MLPSSVLGAAMAAPATVRITEKGRDACPRLCPEGSTAQACAAEWEEAGPCSCLLCHTPAMGLPTVPRARWLQIVTERGVLYVPAATVAAIEGR